MSDTGCYTPPNTFPEIIDLVYPVAGPPEGCKTILAWKAHAGGKRHVRYISDLYGDHSADPDRSAMREAALNAAMMELKTLWTGEPVPMLG